ncbi:MAG: tRNA dihydrouridine synthase DusB [Firmicutes bacterium]|nr:tRNA dihydrouridine synthase DusB [Bacillota bacterium]
MDHLHHTYKIGTVELAHPFLMAPLAGITDSTFRLLCSRQGAAMTYSEMISAKGLVYGDRGSAELLRMEPGEGLCSCQLFGSEEEFIRKAVQKLSERERDFLTGVPGAPLGHSLIDINMGCPVPKVVKGGEGSALMKDPWLAADLVRAAVRAEAEEAEEQERLPRPVTVKCRIGWDEPVRETVLEFAPRMQEAGAAAIGVHGRTREQFYSGKSDWELVARVKERITVPLIGSGDLFTAKDAVEHLRAGHCDMVMFARGALGNPWIFRQALDLWEGRPQYEPTGEERRAMMLEHLELAIACKGERRAVREMRKNWGWYMKGLPGAAQLRRRVCEEESAAGLRNLLETIDFT